MLIEERYKLFVSSSKLIGGCDHIGPSPTYDSVTQELLGYRVGLYRGRLLDGLYLAQGEGEAEIFPLEAWDQKRNAALAHLQK